MLKIPQKNKIISSSLNTAAVLFIITAAMIMSIEPMSSDTWFILATGREIVESGTVPLINPFSIVNNLKIIVQQWAFDVIVYKLYQLGGFPAITLLVSISSALFVILFYVLSGFWSQNKSVRYIATAAGSMYVLLFQICRPTIITLLIITVELIVLEQWKKTDKKRFLFFLPVLAFLQINVHASMISALFIMMLPYVVPKSLDKLSVKLFFKSCNYILLVPAAAMLLASLLNPNGVRGILYLFLSYGTASNLPIDEIASPDVFSFCGIVIILSALILFYYCLKFQKSVDFQKVCMAAGCLFLSLLHVRDFWFLAFGIVPVLCMVLPDREYFSFDKLTSAALISFSLCAILLYSFRDCEPEESNYTTTLAADYLDTVDEDIVLYTEFNNGAYMEWRGYKVFLDGRPEIWEYKINGVYDFCSEFMTVWTGSADYDSFINKYDFNYLLVSDDSYMDLYLRTSDGFDLVVDGNEYNLFYRETT